MQPCDLVEMYLSQGQLSQALQLWLVISCCGLQSADAVSALHVSMCSTVLASITAHPQDRCPAPPQRAFCCRRLVTRVYSSVSQCAQAMHLLLDVQPPPAALPLVIEMRKNLYTSHSVLCALVLALTNTV